jgi:mono/diheme cytochrome c family protein
MKKVLLIALAVGFALSTIEAPIALAQDDGAALLEQRCSVCHPSARPKSKQKTPEQWEATVTRMMGKGAQLTPEEKKGLIDYLSKTYKP